MNVTKEIIFKNGKRLYSVSMLAYYCSCGHKNLPLPLDYNCEKCGGKLIK